MVLTVNPSIRATAIIPSAGMGKRMGGRAKNYLPLAGRPVLAHTLTPFEKSALIAEVVLVVPEADIDFCTEEIVERYNFTKVKAVVAGGSERQYSVANGLDSASPEADIIVVHDGARALLTTAVLESVIREAATSGAAVTAALPKDTIIEVSSDGRLVKGALDRSSLRAVQTPQAFKSDIVRRAYGEAARDGFLGTDSSSLVLRLSIEVAVVEGSYENIKITTPEDLLLAESIVAERAG